MYLPENIKNIITQLNNNGFDSYVVGGACRDHFLGLTPKDYDIVTNALPEQIEAAFPGSTVNIGKSFGVITIKPDIEVATFRTDGPGRKPEVEFSTSLFEDSCRRDFTCNAIYYSPTLGFIDPQGGIVDLTNNVLRSVGNASERIQEDPLRILRVARFMGKGFNVSSVLVKAVRENLSLLRSLSAERVKQEMEKILLTQQVRNALVFMVEVGIIAEVFVEIHALTGVSQRADYHPEIWAWDHTVNVIERCTMDPVMRWAALFHDVGKSSTTTPDGSSRGHEQKSVEIAERYMRKLKFSNKERNDTLWIIKNHMRIKQFFKMKRNKQRLLMSHPLFLQLAMFAGCDQEVGVNITPSLIEHYDQTPPLPKAFLTGNDIIVNNKRIIGKVLDRVYIAQLENRVTNESEALHFAEQLIKGWDDVAI